MILYAPPTTIAARLAARTRKGPKGCRNWIGCTNNKGYGCISIGKKGKNALVHRVAWFLHHGSIDAALTIDHLCRNRACVNVAHMELVPGAENTRRGESAWAVNARKTHCPKGHPLRGKNLIVHTTRGTRHCRTCQKATQMANWRRVQAATYRARAALAKASQS